jgi:hypothetical protein
VRDNPSHQTIQAVRNNPSHLTNLHLIDLKKKKKKTLLFKAKIQSTNSSSGQRKNAQHITEINE